jgi:hypothetical protein
MFRQAVFRTSSATFKSASKAQLVGGSRRWIQTNANAARGRRSGNTVALVAAAAALGSWAVYSGQRRIHNDAKNEAEGSKAKLDSTLGPGIDVKDEDSLHSLVWGSNRCATTPASWASTYRKLRTRVLSPTSKQHDLIRAPAVANWLDGVALRDLQLHETYGACVDAHGDVYQWGDGFYAGVIPPGGQGLPPKITLKGKVRSRYFLPGLSTNAPGRISFNSK